MNSKVVFIGVCFFVQAWGASVDNKVTIENFLESRIVWRIGKKPDGNSLVDVCGENVKGFLHWVSDRSFDSTLDSGEVMRQFFTDLFVFRYPYFKETFSVEDFYVNGSLGMFLASRSYTEKPIFKDLLRSQNKRKKEPHLDSVPVATIEKKEGIDSFKGWWLGYFEIEDLELEGEKWDGWSSQYSRKLLKGLFLKYCEKRGITERSIMRVGEDQLAQELIFVAEGCESFLQGAFGAAINNFFSYYSLLIMQAMEEYWFGYSGHDFMWRIERIYKLMEVLEKDNREKFKTLLLKDGFYEKIKGYCWITSDFHRVAVLINFIKATLVCSWLGVEEWQQSIGDKIEKINGDHFHSFKTLPLARQEQKILVDFLKTLSSNDAIKIVSILRVHNILKPNLLGSILDFSDNKNEFSFLSGAVQETKVEKQPAADSTKDTQSAKRALPEFVMPKALKNLFKEKTVPDIPQQQCFKPEDGNDDLYD